MFRLSVGQLLHTVQILRSPNLNFGMQQKIKTLCLHLFEWQKCDRTLMCQPEGVQLLLS